MLDSMPRRIRIAGKVLGGLVGIAAAVLAAWSVAIGPEAVGRVLVHGTTTVWDHLEYPDRELRASPRPRPWPRTAETPGMPATATVRGEELPLEAALRTSRTLALVVVREGELAYEWYAADHGPHTPSMLFSVTKSVLSLMVGAALEGGILGSVGDPVTAYVPELGGAGFRDVTLEELLRMDSGLDYVESDNPFGIHVGFNYTADLEDDILALRVRQESDRTFSYKSGDYALLGLVLDRALGERTLTGYLQDAFWNPLGAEDGGAWSTDHEGGLERAWCCLAVTARDLARLGLLALRGGTWEGERILPEGWTAASFEPAYPAGRWPEDLAGSPLANYGYGWWLIKGGGVLALGKDGQYIFLAPDRNVVVVRLGEAQGGVESWVRLLRRVAASGAEPAVALLRGASPPAAPGRRSLESLRRPVR